MSGYGIFIAVCGVALCFIGAWPLGILAIAGAVLVGGGEQHIEDEAAKLFTEDGAGNLHVAPGASSGDVERHLGVSFGLMAVLLLFGVLFVAVLIVGAI